MIEDLLEIRTYPLLRYFLQNTDIETRDIILFHDKIKFFQLKYNDSVYVIELAFHEFIKTVVDRAYVNYYGNHGKELVTEEFDDLPHELRITCYSGPIGQNVVSMYIFSKEKGSGLIINLHIHENQNLSIKDSFNIIRNAITDASETNTRTECQFIMNVINNINEQMLLLVL